MSALLAEPVSAPSGPEARPAAASPATPSRRERRLLGGLLSLRDPAEGEPRRDRWAELALFGAMLLISALTPAHTSAGLANAPGMELLDRATGGGLCLFRRWTGVECGGCGLTRGFVQLAHGDVVAAVRLNPLAPLLFAWVAWRVVELAVLLGARRELSIAVPQRWKWRYYGGLLGGLGLLAGYRLGVHLLS